METSNTTSYLGPIITAKGAFGRGFCAMAEGSFSQQHADDLLAALNDPRYDNYMRAFGKLAFMLPLESTPFGDNETRAYTELHFHGGVTKTLLERGIVNQGVLLGHLHRAHHACNLIESLSEGLKEKLRGSFQ